MKKKGFLWFLGFLAAAAGIAVAVTAFMKKQSKKFISDMEFDESLYFEDEDEDDLYEFVPESDIKPDLGGEDEELKF